MIIPDMLATKEPPVSRCLYIHSTVHEMSTKQSVERATTRITGTAPNSRSTAAIKFQGILAPTDRK